MTLNELGTKLTGSGISDILLTGFIDQDETPVRFHPMAQIIYFECSSLYLKFEAISTSGNLRISIDDKIEVPAQVEEEGMTAAVMSLREQYLDDSEGTNDIGAIRLWSATEGEAGFRCAAAQLELVNGQKIFVDPSYHFGIRIGGPPQREIWLKNWPAAEQAVEHVVSLIESQ